MHIEKYFCHFLRILLAKNKLLSPHKYFSGVKQLLNEWKIMYMDLKEKIKKRLERIMLVKLMHTAQTFLKFIGKKNVLIMFKIVFVLWNSRMAHTNTY